jgi:hypothetical protein
MLNPQQCANNERVDSHLDAPRRHLILRIRACSGCRCAQNGNQGAHAGRKTVNSATNLFVDLNGGPVNETDACADALSGYYVKGTEYLLIDGLRSQ